ncbi:MAG: copper transporter [Crocinitomicaceae bacterium]|nr:copper transporter [Crocinitomicaceae bacterium]|tara:strand:- start:2475 stop:5999 length:3525 start_codon:yes stop_codon:yes gene_type:complete
MKKQIENWREFGLSSLAINNRKTVYLIIAILLIGGISSYNKMPRESFPQIEVPEIYVNIPYPGNSAEIITDKIIKPFEKELNKLKGVDEISSTSIQDFAVLQIKFDFGISPKDAKRFVEEALSDAKSTKTFAQDLPVEPTIQEIDVNEFPIININLSGDYPVDVLKEQADLIKDLVETIPEINAVDIRGVQIKKVKIEVRKFDAEAKRVSFSDIESAIQSENTTLGAGNLKVDGIDHFLILDGKFKDFKDLENLVVKHEDQDNIYLRDVADVSFADADTSSYARQNGEPVVMLDVKKRAGANIINAIDQLKVSINSIESKFPKDMKLTYTNDQSIMIRSQVSNLENSIVFGVILVVFVLLFFLGLRNALFVGIAIPFSMFLSFILLNSAGVSLNIMVLFSLVLALGMLVDNGIVVVENVYRLMDEGYSPFEATKKGVGEVAWPIIASTATTLAAFVPLALWPGIMGEFMQYLPITLMIVLGSSLFVALVINPVLIAVLMRVDEEKVSKKRAVKYFLIIGFLSVPFYLISMIWLANLLVVFALLTLLNAFILSPMTIWFQEKFLPKIENGYKRFLSWSLNRKRPIWIISGTIITLFLSFFLTGIFPPKVLFFPDNQPNYINIFVELPVGTNISKTNKNTLLVKAAIDSVLNSPVSENDSRSLLEVVDEESKNGVKIETAFIASVIEQVGKGTSDPMNGPSFGETPHKARITVSFCEFSHRNGINTSEVKKRIEKALTGKFNADIGIIVDKEQNGPPQKPAINIEITGSDDYGLLTEKARVVQQYLIAKNISGVQKLKLDVEVNKAEINLEIDREYAKRVGLSTGQIGQNIRTSLFGKDISTYSFDEEDYDINIRFAGAYRSNLESILNQKVMFMNNRGQKLTIPVSAVVKDLTIVNKHAAIKRKNLTNMVTIISGVKEGYNANEVVAKIKKELNEFQLSDNGKAFSKEGYNAKFTGQMEDQEKEMAFLSTALLIAIFLILLILVTQFNAFSTPVIILSSVILSLSGVFLGIVISRSDFVIIMTMIGIISLAGIVVNNAIVLVDYTNLLRRRKRKELEMNEQDLLSHNDIKIAIIEGGKTRLRPVLLTAITTILGLFPLATGLNINFFTLISEFDPQIFFGGDNVIFFKPMSLAIIYGLTFATFLTLVVVPIMYYTFYRFKIWLFQKMKWELKVEV